LKVYNWSNLIETPSSICAKRTTSTTRENVSKYVGFPLHIVDNIRTTLMGKFNA